MTALAGPVARARRGLRPAVQLLRRARAPPGVRRGARRRPRGLPRARRDARLPGRGPLWYENAALNADGPVIELLRLNAIRSLDEETGLVRAGAGLTLGDLWKASIPKGFWPPVVTGTMHVTLGGAVAVNVHGKNGWKRGTIGDHVESVVVLRAGRAPPRRGAVRDTGVRRGHREHASRGRRRRGRAPPQEGPVRVSRRGGFCDAGPRGDARRPRRRQGLLGIRSRLDGLLFSRPRSRAERPPRRKRARRRTRGADGPVGRRAGRRHRDGPAAGPAPPPRAEAHGPRTADASRERREVPRRPARRPGRDTASPSSRIRSSSTTCPAGTRRTARAVSSSTSCSCRRRRPRRRSTVRSSSSRKRRSCPPWPSSSDTVQMLPRARTRRTGSLSRSTSRSRGATQSS